MIVLPEIADALAEGRPVVALESTIISHGLPRPDNYRIAQEIEQAVRDAGAVPATIAVVDGQARVGLDPAALRVIAERDDVVKVSPRDLGGHRCPRRARRHDGRLDRPPRGAGRASRSSPPAASEGCTAAPPPRTTSRPT